MPDANDKSRRRPTLARMARFYPLNQLEEADLADIARRAEISELPDGFHLFKQGEVDPWVYFLLQGNIRLVDGKGEFTEVNATTVQATQPLAPGRPRLVSAVAQGGAEVMRISGKVLEQYTQCDGRGGYLVDELHAEDENVRNQIYYRLYMDYIEDKLEVPGLPEISMRIRHAVEDDKTTSADIALMLQAEPALAAYLVKVANSAAYRGAAPVINLRDAVVRLGMKAARDLVIQFTVQRMFKTNHAVLKKRMIALWQHSTLVAAISHLLSRNTHRFLPEQASLAGLVHSIGKAALISRVDDYPELVRDPVLLDQILNEIGGEVGAMVLRKWGFTEPFVQAARESSDWGRDPKPEADLCDLVLVAKLYAYQEELANSDAPALESLPAYRKLGLTDPRRSDGRNVMREAKEEIMHMRQLLSAA